MTNKRKIQQLEREVEELRRRIERLEGGGLGSLVPRPGPQNPPSLPRTRRVYPLPHEYVPPHTTPFWTYGTTDYSK